ncbi:interleukin-2 receptor subunit alpha isoform X2 [Columba livia]|uniref:interleukin-2 receptor subunit alpha isoform X2 n=1 Tax=Columba livia TaxID=8932 RepID=UPI0031BB83EB
MSPMELKCLLMWLLFGSIKGNKTEECPALPWTKFAVSAEMYPLGTKLYYECDSGYTRRSGQYPGIQCKEKQGLASWVYKEFECIVSPTDEKKLLSMSPTMEIDFTQKPERKTQSPAPQKQENLSEFGQKDFCGPPKTIPHASLSLKGQYYVGQVLHFKCQRSYDKQTPTSGTSTCMKVNGEITWTPLAMQCTNDSSYSDESLPQTIEPDPSVSLWCPVQSDPGSPHPSCSSPVMLPVTAIVFVLLIIPTVFV